MSSYATLDEVYGNKFPKKKKSKKNKESLCHQYAKNYSKIQKDLEPYSIQSNYADYQNPNTSMSKRKEELLKKHKKKEEFEHFQDKDEVDADYFDKMYNSYDFKSQTLTDGDHLMKYDSEFAYDDEDDDTKEKEVRKINNEFIAETVSRKTDYEFDKHYMDFALYLISGVLLIFILEQFVQLGMMLKDKKTSHTHYYTTYNPQVMPQQSPPVIHSQPHHSPLNPQTIQSQVSNIVQEFPYTQTVNSQVNN